MFISTSPPRRLTTADLIKIDAEGAEPAILAGMQRLLERAPRVQLVLEFRPDVLARAGHDPHAFLTSLVRLGFRLHAITPRGRCRPITVDRLLASEGEELYLRR
jgi:Methyltransferase FkbM domain